MAASELEKHRRRWEENPKGLTFAPYADALRKSGAAEEALSVLRAGLEFHPDYLPANIVLGRTHLDLGDDASAETAFARVLELDPENVIALKALADVSERAARWDDAERWLGQLLGVDRWNDGAREQMLRVQEARTAAPNALEADASAAGEGADAGAAEPEAAAVSDARREEVAPESAPSVADLVATAASADIELEATAFEAPMVGHRADAAPDGFEAAAQVTDGSAIDVVAPLAGLVSSAYQAEALPSPFEAPAVVPTAEVDVELEVDSTAILAPAAGAAEFAVDDAAASLGASIADEPVAEIVGAGEAADAPDWADIGSGEFVPAMFAETAETTGVVESVADVGAVEVELTVEADTPSVDLPIDDAAEPIAPPGTVDTAMVDVAIESTADIEPLAVVLEDAAAAELALPDLEAAGVVEVDIAEVTATADEPAPAEPILESASAAEIEMAPVVAEPIPSAVTIDVDSVLAAPEPAGFAMADVVATADVVVVAEPPASVAEPEPEPPAEPWDCCDWSAEPLVTVDDAVLAALGPKVAAPPAPAPVVAAPAPEPEITDPWQCADWTAEPVVAVDDAVLAALGPARVAAAPTVVAAPETAAVVEAVVVAAPDTAAVAEPEPVVVAEPASELEASDLEASTMTSEELVEAHPATAPLGSVEGEAAVPVEPRAVVPDEDAAAAPPDFAAPVLVTAAMAMLYESQGHHGDALRVYRELDLREPGVHAARIADLEARLAAAVPAPPVFAARATGGRSVRDFLQGVVRGAPAALLAPRTVPGDGPALRRAEDDVSLGRIFGEEPGATATAARPLSVAARPQATMDEFYGAAPSTPAASDDLEQFHAWLQGLKT